MALPTNYRYTKEHEWIRVEGDTGVIGITDYAQHSLGDIVYVEAPQVGATITTGESFGTVESVKAVSEIYAPVTGTVLEVNQDLVNSPELVNREPFAGGWLIKVKLGDPGQVQGLLTAAGYDAFIAAEKE